MNMLDNIASIIGNGKINKTSRAKAEQVLDALEDITPEMDSAGSEAYPRQQNLTGIAHQDLWKGMLKAARAEDNTPVEDDD